MQSSSASTVTSGSTARRSCSHTPGSSPIPAVHGIIRVSLDAVDAVIERQLADNASLHEQTVALALGRVLAHEVGHVLLGAPGYHDPVGLMRARFPTTDLVRWDRSSFRLMDCSFARLRERIATFSERQPPEHCGKGEP